MTSKTPHADPVVTLELVKQHGLTPEEFEQIKEILGREPNFTELGIFSVMWSEHCSYKNSRKELKKFPTTGANILVKAGEEIKRTRSVRLSPESRTVKVNLIKKEASE